MTDDPAAEYSEALVFRRGKLRKRDDPAIDLFREALASLDDLTRVRRILVELGRLYDPVSNGPIVDTATRREVIECLEAGRVQGARQAMEAALGRYTRPARPQPGGRPG